MSSIMPWMEEMLENMKNTLISKMNEEAANKTSLEAENRKLRLEIDNDTIYSLY